MSKISSIDVHLLELPLNEPFVASHGQTLDRTIVAIRITTDTGSGWGECSALPAATYTAESATGAFNALCQDLGPRLIGADLHIDAGSNQADPDPAGGGSSGGVVDLLYDAGQPMAVAGLEMALLDAQLKASGHSLATWMGVEATSVAAGVSIGLDTVEATVAKAVALAADGYRRLKVKIQPGHDGDLISALRRELPDIELQVDANGAYPAEAIEWMLQLVDLGADALEQPFARSEAAAAAELVKRLRPSSRALVVADEAVSSVTEAKALLATGAMTALSIKPGRVGGLTTALTLHELCLSNGLAATAGGMLETGLGRRALAALAGLPGFSLIGDLSPAARWLAADPWPDLEMTDGRIIVPTSPGVAPEPDPYVLERYCLERRRIS